MALGSAQSGKVGHRMRKLGTSHHGFDSIFSDQKLFPPQLQTCYAPKRLFLDSNGLQKDSNLLSAIPLYNSLYNSRSFCLYNVLDWIQQRDFHSRQHSRLSPIHFTTEPLEHADNMETPPDEMAGVEDSTALRALRKITYGSVRLLRVSTR